VPVIELANSSRHDDSETEHTMQPNEIIARVSTRETRNPATGIISMITARPATAPGLHLAVYPSNCCTHLRNQDVLEIQHEARKNIAVVALRNSGSSTSAKSTTDGLAQLPENRRD